MLVHQRVEFKFLKLLTIHALLAFVAQVDKSIKSAGAHSRGWAAVLLLQFPQGGVKLFVTPIHLQCSHVPLEYFRILCFREWIQNPAQFGSHWHGNRGYGASLPRGTKPVDFLEHRDQNLATLKPFPKTQKNSLDIHLNYSNYSCSGRS